MSDTPILPLPIIDATQMMEQLRAAQKHINDMTGISGIFATGERDFIKPVYGDRRYFPLDYRRVPAWLPTMQILQSEIMTVPAEDWSRVRSPGRARRRLKRGYRQNIRYYQAPDPNFVVTGDQIVGHPDTIDKMMTGMAKRAEVQREVAAYGALMGWPR